MDKQAIEQGDEGGEGRIPNVMHVHTHGHADERQSVVNKQVQLLQLTIRAEKRSPSRTVVYGSWMSFCSTYPVTRPKKLSSFGFPFTRMSPVMVPTVLRPDNTSRSVVLPAPEVRRRAVRRNRGRLEREEAREGTEKEKGQREEDTSRNSKGEERRRGQERSGKKGDVPEEPMSAVMVPGRA